MKMHFLDGGRLRMKKRIFVPTAERDEMIEMPVISTLFRRASANILFDTGCHPSVEADAEKRWGGLAKLMTPIGSPNSNVISDLAKLDLVPDDIDLVINSHLHPDHCGCNEFFRKASFMCHADELAAAKVQGAESQGYLRAEWDYPMPIEPITTSHDVMGDGRMEIIPLPGHTPGTIGLKAGLEREGEFFIVSDALSLKRNLVRDEIPKNAWNDELLVKSYAEIRHVENSGSKIICGHDDDQWQSLKKGAEFYE